MQPDASDEAVRQLSEAPPDQWGELLSNLGASLHPWTPQSADAPLTVTSLLNNLGPDEVAASERPARRRKQRELKPSAPAEADTRDLEELLKGLGEEPSQAAKKGKKKATKVSTQPDSSPVEEPKGPEAVATSTTEAPAKVAKAAKASSRSKKTAAALAPASPRREAAIDSAAAASAEQEQRAQPPDDAEVSADALQPSEAEVQEHQAVDWLPVETRAAKRQAAKARKAAEAEPSDTAQQEAVFESRDSAQAPAESGSDTERAKVSSATANMRSLSVGDLPEACTASSQAAAARRHPVQRCSSPAAALQSRRAASQRPSSPEPAAAAQSSLSARRQWHAQPSVGTWLAPPPCWQPEAPAPAPVARSASPCYGQRSMSLKRSLSKEIEPLWPSTPTSTPPDSPRFQSGICWVPVPTHLLGAVQRLVAEDAWRNQNKAAAVEASWVPMPNYP